MFMASHQVKTGELRTIDTASNNGCTSNYAQSEAVVEKGREYAASRDLQFTLTSFDRQHNSALRGWPSLMDRFWASVRKTDTCWWWQGTVCNGYGQIAIGPGAGQQKRYRAHRLSWLWHYGDIPAGKIVMHAVCDEPLCVRPDHLQLGTQKQNMEDASQKGRMQWRSRATRFTAPQHSYGGGVRSRLKGKA